MIIFSTVMFILAAVLLIPALLLYQGSTGWLHSFKKGRYKDPKAYAQLLGKTLFYIALSFVASGFVALINDIPLIIPLIIMIAGIVYVMILACKKAMKYYE